MHSFIGLGNPTEKYQNTRHNAGFLVIDALASALGASWQVSKRCHAEVALLPTTILIKPTTYMNEVGRAARAVLDYYKIDFDGSAFTAIHDDLDIQLGEWKYQFDKGPKIHNGLQSLYNHLHTKSLWHCRIGVDGRGGIRDRSGKDYVLEDFMVSEKAVLQHLIETEVVPALLSQLSLY